jgi:cytochrome c peroxidase
LMKPDPRRLEKEAIARGELLFNTAPVTIQDVKGLNDALGVTTIVGTCTTCHDTPNVGDHSLSLPLDIGISDVPTSSSDPVASALAELNPPKTPVFQLTCTTQLGAPSNLVVQTTDPGRAMVTGHCADIGKFKGPILHGLPGHAPYFQNGSADTLEQVVQFYNQRFQMGLKANEEGDLVAFLRSL